ncbi:Acetyltransferase (GNAT) family, partial [Dysosmobacter welbionis]
SYLYGHTSGRLSLPGARRIPCPTSAFFRTVTGHWRAIPKAPQQTGRKMPRLSRGALLCTEGGSNMTFQQLSFVVEVANCESINKAAERLYTSQSNVSNSIKALEEELGIQIFLRTKKGVSVTEEGREFLSY